MTPTLSFQHAETEAEIAACFSVMQQLRPRLQTGQELVTQVLLQRAQAYRLLALCNQGQPVALAGYRQLDNLVHGKFIYVDDLITTRDARGCGHGEQLIAELRDIGRRQQCNRLVLDTALANPLAQRFYFRVGMLALGLHFSMELQ